MYRTILIAALGLLAVVPSAGAYTPPLVWCDDIYPDKCYSHDAADEMQFQEVSGNFQSFRNPATGQHGFNGIALGCQMPATEYPAASNGYCQVLDGIGEVYMFYQWADGWKEQDWWKYHTHAKQQIVVTEDNTELLLTSFVSRNPNYDEPPIDTTATDQEDESEEATPKPKPESCPRFTIKRVGVITAVRSRGATCAQARGLAARVPKGRMLADWACSRRKVGKVRFAKCVLIDDDEVVGVVALRWKTKV